MSDGSSEVMVRIVNRSRLALVLLFGVSWAMVRQIKWANRNSQWFDIRFTCNISPCTLCTMLNISVCSVSVSFSSALDLTATKSIMLASACDSNHSFWAMQNLPWCEMESSIRNLLSTNVPGFRKRFWNSNWRDRLQTNEGMERPVVVYIGTAVEQVRALFFRFSDFVEHPDGVALPSR